jgi:hypothetical protein
MRMVSKAAVTNPIGNIGSCGRFGKTPNSIAASLVDSG